jgi:hypothetical protein
MTNEIMIAEGLAEQIADRFVILWDEEGRFDQSASDYRYDCALRAARIVLRDFMIDGFSKLVTESVTKAIQEQRRRFMENDDHD